jgi:hypothetical protein
MGPPTVVKPKKARAVKTKSKPRFKSEARVKEESSEPVTSEIKSRTEPGPRLPSAYASKADIEASAAAALQYYASTVSLYTPTSKFGANHFTFEGKQRKCRASGFR